ncbi:MAG: hypothetical protein BWY77_01763 [bacterium ADurb.Bin431]|nr:MAG: hypothetical protein BWY77_01763 [bacterium ADurb.Bin431]
MVVKFDTGFEAGVGGRGHAAVFFPDTKNGVGLRALAVDAAAACAYVFARLFDVLPVDRVELGDIDHPPALAVDLRLEHRGRRKAPAHPRQALQDRRQMPDALEFRGGNGRSDGREIELHQLSGFAGRFRLLHLGCDRVEHGIPAYFKNGAVAALLGAQGEQKDQDEEEGKESLHGFFLLYGPGDLHRQPMPPQGRSGRPVPPAAARG